MTDLRGRCSSAIDTMANLPLLYWAARFSGDGSYRLAADAHARMTARSFVRADDSTWHAVEYDPQSGERGRGYTFQGAHDESAWAPGQAWAIYGFVESARETGRLEHLQLAERLTRYYVRRLGERQIPPWDFDAQGDDARILDSAAAAVVASALIELGRIHPQPGIGASWAGRGLAMLEALCAEAFAHEDTHRGLLKHGCYSKPHGEGIDSATMFGDWFFIEALTRAALPGALQPVLPAPQWR